MYKVKQCMQLLQVASLLTLLGNIFAFLINIIEIENIFGYLKGHWTSLTSIFFISSSIKDCKSN